jgi:hypothetical protein
LNWHATHSSVNKAQEKRLQLEELLAASAAQLRAVEEAKSAVVSNVHNSEVAATMQLQQLQKQLSEATAARDAALLSRAAQEEQGRKVSPDPTLRVSPVS